MLQNHSCLESVFWYKLTGTNCDARFFTPPGPVLDSGLDGDGVTVPRYQTINNYAFIFRFNVPSACLQKIEIRVPVWFDPAQRDIFFIHFFHFEILDFVRYCGGRGERRIQILMFLQCWSVRLLKPRSVWRSVAATVNSGCLSVSRRWSHTFHRCER